MNRQLDFFDIFTSPSDGAGISLYELRVLAKGSIFGVPGGGASPENTLFASFSSASLGVPFTFVNDTGLDFAVAFSGTFNDGLALIDPALLLQDIKLQYRITTATGVGRWNTLHFYAICPPGEVALTVSPPTGTLDDQFNFSWYWTIQAQRSGGNPLIGGDQLLIEVLREDLSVFGYTFLAVGADPTNSADTTNSLNWTSSEPRDGNIASYLTVETALTSPNLLAGTAELKFKKKLFAVDNGIAGIDAGESMTVRVTCITGDCQQTPTPDTGIMTPLVFIELLAPFVGKQAAGPYPESRYPIPGFGTNFDIIPQSSMCVNTGWVGLSIRNGVLTASIKSVDIDLVADLQSDGFYDAANAGINFPLPPMLYADNQPSCAAPGSTSTPLLGFDFSAWFVDPSNGFFQGEGPVGTLTATGIISILVTTVFDIPYYGEVTCLQTLRMKLDAQNTNSADGWPLHSWTFPTGFTGILIARADAEVYSQYTTNIGLTGMLAFNVNTTRLNNFPVVSNWAPTTGCTIYDDPAGGAGSNTVYDIVDPVGPGVTGGLDDPPTSGVAAKSININHAFPSEGLFRLFFNATMNGSGARGSIESFALVVSA